jgi:hypothetical protein
MRLPWYQGTTLVVSARIMVICLFRDRSNAGESLESLAQLAIQVGHHRGARGSPMPIAWALSFLSSEADERTAHDPYPEQFP